MITVDNWDSIIMGTPGAPDIKWLNLCLKYLQFMYDSHHTCIYPKLLDHMIQKIKDQIHDKVNKRLETLKLKYKKTSLKIRRMKV